MLQIFRRLTEHPLTKNRKTATIVRYLTWQFSSRTGNPETVKTWVGGLRLMVKRGFHASTACHYFGLPEFESMGFLLHFLRPNDLFVDAGANIGAYSLLASGITGAKSMAFEPEPYAANLLLKNSHLNQLGSLIELNEIGLGAQRETLQMTTNKGIQNHISTDSKAAVAPIGIVPLDDFCEAKPPVLIKIDVEGFETAVVNGAQETLSNPKVKALIVEQMGLGKRFGYDEAVLHTHLLSFGFQLFDYQPFTKKIHQLELPIFGNNFYFRDLAFIENRIKNSSKFTVNGRSF